MQTLEGGVPVSLPSPCDSITPSLPSQYILLKKTLEHQFPNLLEFVSVPVTLGGKEWSGFPDP